MQPIHSPPIGTFIRKVIEGNLVTVNRYPPMIRYKNPPHLLHTP